MCQTRLKLSWGVNECKPLDEGGGDNQSTGQLLRLFKLLRLFRLVKLLRVFKIMRLFERYQDDLFRYMHLLSVGKLIIIMLVGSVGSEQGPVK